MKISQLLAFTCALACSALLVPSAVGQSAAQLLQKAAEMDRLADEARRRGDHLAPTNRTDASYQYAAERQFRLGAAQLRQQATRLGVSSAGGGFSGGAAGGAMVDQMQNLVNLGQQLDATRAQREAREAAKRAAQERATTQAEADQAVREAESLAAMQWQAMENKRMLEASKAQFNQFYDKDVTDLMKDVDAMARAAPQGSALSSWKFDVADKKPYADVWAVVHTVTSNQDSAKPSPSEVVASVIGDRPKGSSAPPTTPKQKAATDAVADVLGLPKNK